MAYITLDNCTLHLPVYGTGNRSLKQMVLSAATGGRIASNSRNITVVEALRNITLDIRAGDRVGLVGHNGAGKTTLLRMLAGIYEPTFGTLRSEGRVTSLLDVTLGLDYEATGYDPNRTGPQRNPLASREGSQANLYVNWMAHKIT